MMPVSCPSCNKRVQATDVPERGPTGGDWWICLCCDYVICTGCYIKHNDEKHAQELELCVPEGIAIGCTISQTGGEDGGTQG